MKKKKYSCNFKNKDGRLFMVRCPRCEEENYAPAVPSGICVNCGYELKEEDVSGADTVQT